jgi:8-oxo-dGTP diphosphatase
LERQRCTVEWRDAITFTTQKRRSRTQFTQRPALALLDSDGNILLLRRKDNDKWTMPDGTLDFGESLTFCAIREMREESGLQIRITGLIGTYTDPYILIAYSDGEVRQEFTFVNAARIESGELKIDDECEEAAWVPVSSAVELPLAQSQRCRLKYVLEYQKERRTFSRYRRCLGDILRICCCFRE